MTPWVLVSLGHGRRQKESTEYQRWQENAAIMAAQRGGLEARISVAEGDVGVQTKQILEAVSAPAGQRPVAVVVCTVSVVGFDRVARSALAAGVGWVVVDNVRPLSSLLSEFPDQLVSWASVDYVETGRLSARMAKALLPSGGRVLCLEGPSVAAAALQRRRGIEEVFKESQIEIGDTLVGDWKPAGAARETTAWLERTGSSAVKPDLVVSHNDEMAEALLRVFREKRPAWGKVPAIGCDGLPDVGQRLVNDGDLLATIINPAASGPGVDLVVRWLRGEKVDPVVVPVRPYPAIEELAPLSRGA